MLLALNPASVLQHFKPSKCSLLLVLVCFLETCLASGWQWPVLTLGVMFSQGLSHLHTCVAYSWVFNRYSTVFCSYWVLAQNGFKCHWMFLKQMTAVFSCWELQCVQNRKKNNQVKPPFLFPQPSTKWQNICSSSDFFCNVIALS